MDSGGARRFCREIRSLFEALRENPGIETLELSAWLNQNLNLLPCRDLNPGEFDILAAFNPFRFLT
jgi:hypothetical protein